jgi:hypothetical protein
MCHQPGSSFRRRDVEEGERSRADFLRPLAGDEFGGDFVGANFQGDRVLVVFDGAGELSDREAREKFQIGFEADDAISHSEFSQGLAERLRDPGFVFGVEGHGPR